MEKKQFEMTLQDTVENMISKDYKKRLIAEYQQCEIRFNRLIDVMNRYGRGYNSSESGDIDISLLRKQADIMRAYMFILLKRAVKEGIDLL